MAMNDFNIGFLAGLDGTKSKAKLNQDIDAIKKSLKELELKAKLDPNQVKALENQLNTLKVNLNNVSIDKASLNNLVSQINNSLSGIRLQIPNLNAGNVGNQAQQVGQQIGKQVQNGINSVIQKGSFEKIFRASGNGINNVSKDAEAYFKTLSNTVSVQERLGNNNNLTSFTVSLKNAEGVAEQLNYQLRKITDDKGNIIDRYFEYSGGSINDNGVIQQMNTISAKADSLQTKLEKLKSSYSDMNASRPIKDSNNISALSQQYDKVTKSIENVRNADSASFSSMVSNAQREITVLENMVSQFRNAENVATQMKSVDISSGIAQAQERLGKLKANSSGFDQMKQTIVDLDTAIANVGDKSSLDAFINKLKVAESQLGRVKAETKQLQDVNKIQLSWSDGSYEAKYDSLIAKTRQWVDANDESVISTQKLTTAYNEFNQAASNFAKDGTVANRQKLIDAEEELGRQLKSTTNDIKVQNAEWAKSSKVDSLHQKIQEFYDKNTATHRQWGGQLQNLLNETAHGAQVTATRVNEIEQEFLSVSNAARQAGKLGQSFFGSIKEQASKFVQWFSVTSVVMEGVQAIKKMVTEVKTLDNAMMDLTMATGYNRTQVEALMDTYFKLGDKLSATASDVAASADTWLRQGKSIAETNKLIEDSMVLSKIGGLSSEDSTKYLTSVMKGYKVATEDVIGVVDKLSAVDMASATDVGGLAEGMSEVAASADLAGVSMDKLLGYLATIGEVTQSGMGEVGTTLNAVFARMGNIKLSRLKDYETGEDLSNVETVLRGVGINLRDSMNSFRDFDEVLDETASNWNNYSEVQQRAIAQAFSGTHHMNEFIILMENYDTALKYTETSLGSTGQAMEKFEAYEESIAGHTEKFKNAFQDLSNSVIDSGLINFFIDLGTTGIKAVDGLVDALGGLGAIGAIGGGILGAKNIGKVYECTFANCFEYALHT